MLSLARRAPYFILKKRKKFSGETSVRLSQLIARDINIKRICGREWDFFGGDLNERALSVIEF